MANSLAIMTDAAHLLSDFAGFMISLLALWVVTKPATTTLSFGWHRAGIHLNHKDGVQSKYIQYINYSIESRHEKGSVKMSEWLKSEVFKSSPQPPSTQLANSQPIGNFRVAFRLCFKASPSVKPFIWKLVLFTRKFWFIYMWIKLISIWKASH